MLNVNALHQQIITAYSRINKFTRFTYIEPTNMFSDSNGCSVWFKLENLQITGSFKLRGALNKVLSLKEDSLSRGIVTASTGNHGIAVAQAASIAKTKAIVFVPNNASEEKVEKVKIMGAEVKKIGNDCVEAEYAAREFAFSQNIEYISPYNDVKVIAGQGTIGIEIEEQINKIDTVFASVGGGGLISGIGAYLKSRYPRIKIIGCSPENSSVMIQSIKAGRILDLPSLPTLSDGTAGGLEKGAITFNLCRTLVDEMITVSEDEIKDALRLFLKSHHMLIEGAAGVAIAGYLKFMHSLKNENIVIILCGANISTDKLKKVLCV